MGRRRAVDRRFALLLWAALFLLPAPSAFAGDKNPTVLEVTGEVDQPLRLTLADLRAMPRISTKAREKSGDDASFEGVALSEIIRRARPRLTEKCCGNAANTGVVIRA